MMATSLSLLFDTGYLSAVLTTGPSPTGRR